MRREWLILVICIHQSAITSASRATGQLFVFGKIGKDVDSTRLGEAHASFIENSSEKFIGFGAGHNMAAAIDSNGLAHRFNDISPDASFLSQVAAPDDRYWCQICRGDMHTVAVTCDGDPFTWGLRRTATPVDDPPKPPSTPIPIDVGGERVLQISCGQNHTILLTEARHVYTFGISSHGRLGIGQAVENIPYIEHPTVVQSLSPTELQDGDRVCAIEAGGISTYAITESGKLYSWGGNSFGQLGIGVKSDSEFSPVLVESDPEFVACEVSAGPDFALGYDDKGDVFSWGSGAPNVTRFGLAPATQSVLSLLESRTVQVAAGEYHAVILQDDGSILTYGYNRMGQLGVVINVPMPLEVNPEFEPESPIWTLSPKNVEYLQGKNISSIFAAGNYTAAIQHVSTPHNCPCARGGRVPREFFSWNPTHGPDGPPMREHNQKIPPIQPIRPASSLFEPVSPFVGKKRVDAAPAMPGELAAHLEPREMSEVNYVPMLDDFETQPLELPKRPATFYFYPEGSNDAKAWEDGAEKGTDQKLFGRHMNADGYFYGDYDEEVHARAYTRRALMASSRSDALMPEKGGAHRPAGHQGAGTEMIGDVSSLSLQDGPTKTEGEDAMKQSTLSSIRELRDSHAPVDFATMHVALPEKLDLEGSELMQESSGRPAQILD